MDYVEIRLPKCKVYLTHKEVGELLKNDIELFQLGLKRGKGIHRHRIQAAREQAKFEKHERQKWEREQGLE